MIREDQQKGRVHPDELNMAGDSFVLAVLGLGGLKWAPGLGRSRFCSKNDSTRSPADAPI